MKHSIRKITLVFAIFISLVVLAGCTNEQTNLSLKDNPDEASEQIKLAMQELLNQTYGDKVYDARIYVRKIYTAKEEQEIEVLKEMNLGPNEVAFSIEYEIKPSNNVDPNIFAVSTGYYDKETGWVKEISKVGILRPNTDGNLKYKITNLGTGF